MMSIKTISYTINAAGQSDVGLIRENNEDAWMLIPEHNVYVLADGMGGHSAGEVAAQEAVELYSKFLQDRSHLITLGNAKEVIKEVIQEVNRSVFRLSRADRELRGMGTTLCSVVFLDHTVIYAHVGDSRVYRWRDQKIQQLTEDHSLVQELLDLGELNNRQAREFQKRNIITKAIGTEPKVIPTLDSCDLVEGDYFLMCSDGLSDLLTDREIEKVLNLAASTEQKVALLVQSANRRGGLDNITVILMEVASHGQKHLSRS
jgi:PPM family protein phosphatase